MNESIERAVLERRIKFLEEEARVNKDFRDYVMKRFAAKDESATFKTGDVKLDSESPK